MYEIIDTYCWENHKKVLTFDEHHIKGLKNFAYWNLSRAIPPIPLHHHSDIIEVHCLIKGSWYSQLNDKIYSIKGNELFITFPFEEHSSDNVPQTPCSFYGFQIDIKYKDELLGLNKTYSNMLADVLLNLKARHLKYTSSQASLLKNAFNLISNPNTADSIIGVQYLCCFLFNIKNLEPVNSTKNLEIDKYIQAAIDYIEDNFKEPIQLKELAAIAGYSLSRFKIKFKDEVGITPAEFISLRKIEYAKQQLLHNDISISELAFDLGFSSSNYFASVFNKLTNYTPSNFRRICQETENNKNLID